jgi:hypothetical protein
MPSNQWGEYNNNTGVSAEPVYAPSAAPDPTNDLVPPQSPSGLINPQPADPTGQTNTEGFLAGKFSTLPQQGTATLDSTKVVIAGVAPGALQVFNPTGGTVGSTGDKFS